MENVIAKTVSEMNRQGLHQLSYQAEALWRLGKTWDMAGLPNGIPRTLRSMILLTNRRASSQGAQ